MTCRPEKKPVILRPEGMVLRIHGHRIGRFVLIRKRNMILHSVTGFVFRLNLFQGCFEKRAVLRGNGHDQVGRPVGIAHVVLRLDQMLGERGPAFGRIAVETDDTLRFRTVAQAFIRQDLAGHIFAVLCRVLRLAEHLRCIESKRLDGRCQPGDRRLFIQVLPFFQFVQTGENVLEHTGGGTRGRNEFALSVDRGLFIIGDGRVGLRLVQDDDAPLRGRRSDDFHPGKALFETLYLLLDGLHVRSAVLDLFDVFLAEHSYCISVLLLWWTRDISIIKYRKNLRPNQAVAGISHIGSASACMKKAILSTST